MFEDLQDTRVNKRQRKQEEAELDITPMIDVTFLLLIFFIVASKMDPALSVDMPTAKHGSIVAERDAAVIVVARPEGGGEEPDIFLGLAKNEEAKVTGTEEEQADKIAEYIATELTADKPKTAVLIKAEQGIRYRHIDRVQKAVSRPILDPDAPSPEDRDIRLHLGVIERQ